MCISATSYTNIRNERWEKYRNLKYISYLTDACVNASSSWPLFVKLKALKAIEIDNQIIGLICVTNVHLAKLRRYDVGNMPQYVSIHHTIIWAMCVYKSSQNFN